MSITFRTNYVDGNGEVRGHEIVDVSSIEDIYIDIEDSGLDFEESLPTLREDFAMYDAYARMHYGLPENMDELETLVKNAEENFRGYFQDIEDFGRDYYDGYMGGTESWLEPFIDFAKLGKAQMESYVEHDGYYFSRGS